MTAGFQQYVPARHIGALTKRFCGKNKMNTKGWIAVFATALLGVSQAWAEPAKKTRVGWVERLRVEDVDLQVRAKMDTGATTSSIDADIIDIAKSGEKSGDKPGEKVVFSIVDEKSGEKKTFEREIQRYVRIKKKEGGYIRRPVINMTFCIAGKRVTEEVNLANRENFIYPVLVGRNMLAHAGLMIDASETLVSRPNCEPEEKDKE